MPFSKRLAASRVLFVILPFVLCVSIGVVVGVHGGLHNEAATAFHSSDWSRVIARRNEIRMYGAFVLLVALSVSALSTLALTLSGIFPASRPYPQQTSHNKKAMNEESEIRAVIDKMAEATRAKDIDALLRHYTPDVLSFDVVNPLRYTGADALRKRASEWFSSFQGPIDYEIRDLSITAGDTAAFCHSLNHVIGITTNGQKLDMWWRATIGLRKLEGKWMITHEHSSVPFDTASGQASLGIKP